jgi:hypothetical protein
VIKRNFPQCNHDAMVLQQTHFSLQVLVTALELVRHGLVPWRRTPHGCSNVTVRQNQAIFSGLRFGLIGESISMQRLIQPIAAPITSKNSSCPVSTMSRRRQP